MLWYEFDYDGTSDFLISTLGTDLEPANDTELGLYNDAGELILLDDDSGTFLSALVVSGGDIEAGTYYLAIGGYNTTFGEDWEVTSTSVNTGPLVITGLAIPEPTSLAILGLGGLGLLTRRRKA